jgi:hypothetical protein
MRVLIRPTVTASKSLTPDRAVKQKKKDDKVVVPPPPPQKPPQTARGGDGRNRQETVEAFMQRKSKLISERSWDSSGILEGFEDIETAQGWLADILWSTVLETAGEIRDANNLEQTLLQDLRSNPSFIVGYRSESGFRCDLLHFTPKWLGEHTLVLSSERYPPTRSNIPQIHSQMLGGIASRDHSTAAAMERVIERLGWQAPHLWERFLSQSPAIVFVPQPEIIPQATLPSPVLGIASSGNLPHTSTAGVAAINQQGVEGVTAALHALNNAGASSQVGQQVLVASQPGTVISIDPVSDSAFIELSQGVTSIRTRTFRNVLITPAPGYGQAATFEGCRSGLVSTVITGTSPSLLLSHPLIQRQVLTQPHTNPSDSGCALIDTQDQLVGFCLGSSGTRSPLMFSIWIWADSVFQAHQLT